MNELNRPSYYYEPTLEEVEAILSASPEQISEAVGECIKDKTFWLDLASAFLEGVVCGLTDR